jgi:hypothetical protein
MFINTKHVWDIRRRLARETTFPIPEAVARNTQISLPAALDLTLLKRALRKQDTCAARSLRFFEPYGLSEIQQAVENKRPFRSEAPFAHRSLEAFVIRRLRDVQSDEWVLFRARFAESAAARKKGDLFKGVSSVLAEMGDNVAWHAPKIRGGECFGIAAYHVNERVACFSVADDGRGFLSSLKSNPKWQKLRTEREALEAVLFKHATSRPGETEGGGFKILYNKLLSMNGSVLIRSGSCTARIGSTVEANKIVFREGETIFGAQVTVIVAKKGEPTELPIEKSS